MSNARTGWNAAQRASERSLPKPRKMMTSTPGDPSVAALYEDASHCCRKCGYHWCSCERRDIAKHQALANKIVDHILCYGFADPVLDAELQRRLLQACPCNYIGGIHAERCPAR
jgi:hypothetical protein